MSTLASRIRAHVRDERGVALIMAVGVSMTLAIVAGSVILFVTSNQSQSTRSRQTVNIRGLAQAGIDNAVAQLSQQTGLTKLNGTFFSAMPVADRTATLNGGTVIWSGRFFDETTTRKRWRLSATASAPNPASPGQTMVRTISADVILRPGYVQTMNTEAWNFVYSKNTATPGGCDMTVYNNTTQRTSLYVSGNLCFENSSAIVGPTAAGDEVNLVVQGETNLFGAPVSYIGYDADPPAAVRPLTTVHLALGCRSFANPALHSPCGPVDNVWNGATAPGYFSTGAAPAIAPPTANWGDWYANAAPGPTNGCDPALSSGAYPGAGSTPFDGDGVLNRSLGAFDLAPAAGYVCRATDGAGNLLGELRWIPGGTDRLVIKGTVFFDGSPVLNNEGLIDYDGQGIIYFSGSLYMRQTNLCGNTSGGSCDFTGWNAADNILVLATLWQGAPATAGYGASFQQSQFQGALFTEYPIEVASSSILSGPMVVPRADVRNLSETRTFPVDILLPFGTPGNQIVDWVITPPTNYSG